MIRIRAESRDVVANVDSGTVNETFLNVLNYALQDRNDRVDFITARNDFIIEDLALDDVDNIGENIEILFVDDPRSNVYIKAAADT